MKLQATSTPHILLIDDSKNGLTIRRSLLEEAGFTVDTALNGEEGLKLYESRKFDLIVTDYRMPRMDGLELIKRVRAIDRDVRVILVSSEVDPLGFNEENTGADAVIAKSAHEAGHLLRSAKRLTGRAITRKPVRSQTRTGTKSRAYYA
jgi:CheY-like chemotaxis protein